MDQFTGPVNCRNEFDAPEIDRSDAGYRLPQGNSARSEYVHSASKMRSDCLHAAAWEAMPVNRIRWATVKRRPAKRTLPQRSWGSECGHWLLGCPWPLSFQRSVENTRRNLPICTSSPLSSTADSTASRLT